jgi:hypothetical protein
VIVKLECAAAFALGASWLWPRKLKPILERRPTPMAKIVPISEHYQHFLAEMKESFWGDVYGETKLAWKRLLEADSERQRDRYAVREVYQRRATTSGIS